MRTNDSEESEISSKLIKNSRGFYSKPKDGNKTVTDIDAQNQNNSKYRIPVK